MNTPDSPRKDRPTEPLPKTFRPALMLGGFLLLVTVLLAGAAAVVDRLIYG